MPPRPIPALLLALALAGVAAGQTPAPAPVPVPVPAPTPKPLPPSPPIDLGDEAKAIITLANGRPVPTTWLLGFSIDLSSAQSVAGTKERSVVWLIDDPLINQYSTRRDNGRTISVGTGVRPRKVRVTLKVAKGDTFDETSLEIGFVENPDDPVPAPVPVPTPPPTPGPSPSPVPPAPVFTPGTPESIGQAYARDLIGAASGALKAASASPSADPQSMIAESRKAFDLGLRRAVTPMEADMVRRFGSAASGFDATKVPDVKLYLRGVANGILGGSN